MRTNGLQGSMPEKMPQQVLMHRYFAKTYGWTPQQVEELPLADLNWLPIIEEAEQRVIERYNREASRASSSPRRGR
jgi:hypothetical protein